jgi:nucleotide-binding universal stress UspA family protein
MRRRRILALVDASPESMASAEATAALAADLEAELVGLFVEDPELLALVGDPLARAADFFTATLQPLERPMLERRLRAQEARARALVTRAAELHGVAWSFRVERGDVMDQITLASAEMDLVTAGRVGWSGARGRLGRTARGVLAAGGSVLFHGRTAPARAPVLTCYSASDASPSALTLAADLAEKRRCPITVAIFAPDEDVARLEAEARKRLAGRSLQLRFEHHESDGPRLIQHLRQKPWALLVLPADGPLTADELPEVIAAVEAPVLVVR